MGFKGFQGGFEGLRGFGGGFRVFRGYDGIWGLGGLEFRDLGLRVEGLELYWLRFRALGCRVRSSRAEWEERSGKRV